MRKLPSKQPWRSGQGKRAFSLKKEPMSTPMLHSVLAEGLYSRAFRGCLHDTGATFVSVRVHPGSLL